MAAPIIDRGIPWAPILGNHDHEGDARREDITACLESLPLSLRDLGPEELGACGNLPRGARMIELREGAVDFASWIREESGADACRFSHSGLAGPSI